MNEFHVIVQACPETRFIRKSLTIGSHPTESLDLLPTGLDVPLPATFEQAVARLERLPRLFIEPDGSFVWAGDLPTSRWQLDGQLQDGPRGLVSLDLRGRVPRELLEQLLSCVGRPDRGLLFQLVRAGVFLDEPAFYELVFGAQSNRN